jgi:hypothetical protein
MYEDNKTLWNIVDFDPENSENHLWNLEQASW